MPVAIAHLNRTAILALSSDCCDITLKQLDLKAFLEQSHGQHEASNARPCYQQLGALLVSLVLNWMLQSRRCCPIGLGSLLGCCSSACKSLLTEKGFAGPVEAGGTVREALPSGRGATWARKLSKGGPAFEGG